jgi:hypothetical protein
MLTFRKLLFLFYSNDSACSYQNPKLNDINFMCPKNGKTFKINLRGSGCPVSDPTSKEAFRYSINSIKFSSCGFLVFGLTEIGSIFCCSVLGTILSIISPSNGYSNGQPFNFLPIAPLITVDNVPIKDHRKMIIKNVSNEVVRSDTYIYLLRYLLGLFSHVFSQNFYIIRILKTTHPFLDSSN